MTTLLVRELLPVRRRTAGTEMRKHRDYGVWLVALSATVLSVVSSWSFFVQGFTLSYGDSVSHMEIARRTFDSLTPSLTQLGNVWLPLPHLLDMLFTWDTTLYFSGLAGAIVSMACYVAGSILVYKIVRDLARSRTGVWAGIAGAAVFMCNPNVLYMQSTPMTELLLFTTLLGAIFCLQRWVRNVKQLGYFYAAGMCILAATLTRYEAWVMAVVFIVVVALTVWRRGDDGRRRYQQIEGMALFFSFMSLLGVLGWCFWSGVYFGNLLGWQNGDYAKPSLWVAANEPAIGNLWLSAQTYWYAMVHNLWLPVIALMVLGLVVALVFDRRKLVLLPTISMAVVIPLFFVGAIFAGQRPLHVPEIEGSYYNVRFGLLMVLPAAILIGYLVSLVPTRWFIRPLAALLIVGAAAGWMGYAALDQTQRIATVAEPVSTQHDTTQARDSQAVSDFLRLHYKQQPGLVLAQFFGNERVLFEAGITPGVNIYEGSYLIWPKALADPAGQHAAWIIVNKDPAAGDAVQQVTGLPLFAKQYKQALTNDTYTLYERSDS